MVKDRARHSHEEQQASPDRSSRLRVAVTELLTCPGTSTVAVVFTGTDEWARPARGWHPPHAVILLVQNKDLGPRSRRLPVQPNSLVQLVMALSGRNPALGSLPRASFGLGASTSARPPCTRVQMWAGQLLHEVHTDLRAEPTAR